MFSFPYRSRAMQAIQSNLLPDSVSCGTADSYPANRDPHICSVATDRLRIVNIEYVCINKLNTFLE